jgi:adhesin transport system outer membrane protein
VAGGRIVLSLLTMALLSTTASATTLQQAVQTAVQTNPEVGVVSTDRRAIEYELDQAWALWYPQIDIRGGVGSEWTNSPTTRSRPKAPNDRNTVRQNRTDSEVTLQQRLFDGFEASGEIDRQRARVVSAARRVRETSEVIGLDAIQSYLDVLRNLELVRLAEENISIHQQYAELMSTRVEGGGGSVADVRQAEARLARAFDTLAERRRDLSNASATFIRIVGEEPSDLELPQVPVDALPASVNDALGVALDRNPSIAVAKADVLTARAELKATKAPLYPRLDLEVIGNANQNVDGVEGWNSGLSAMLVMRYNIFRGGADVARKNEHIQRIAEAREQLTVIKRQTEEEVRLSWNALQAARERLQALDGEVAANEQVRDLYRSQFDLGQRTLLDLLDSENELFITKGNRVTQEFVEYFGTYRVLGSVGTLLQTLAVVPPEEATTELESKLAPKLQDVTPRAALPEADDAAGSAAAIGPEALPTVPEAAPTTASEPLPDVLAPPPPPAAAPADIVRQAQLPATEVPASATPATDAAPSAPATAPDSDGGGLLQYLMRDSAR